MYAQITDDKTDSVPISCDSDTKVTVLRERTLVISVDDEAAEVIKFFVDALTGSTKK